MIAGQGRHDTRIQAIRTYVEQCTYKILGVSTEGLKRSYGERLQRNGSGSGDWKIPFGESSAMLLTSRKRLCQFIPKVYRNAWSYHELSTYTSQLC